MALRNSRRVRWPPRGLSDSLDGNNSFPGAMAVLTNLIPDPTTNDSWVCRPAATSLTTFGTFNTPGFISGRLIVGDIEYGMIASARNANKDEPYAYNLATAAFLTVAGINSGNCPTSPATSGDWTPPILAQVGNCIMVTHPGFTGVPKLGWFDVSGFSSNTVTGDTHTNTTIDALSTNVLTVGWQPGMTITGVNVPASTVIISIASNGLSIVISNAATGATAGSTFTVAGGTTAAPLWGAGDLNINKLPSVPVGVAQFNGRAYYACGINGVVYSDSLLPRNRTTATQALTTNDGLAVTALAPVFYTSPLTGGIVQAIVAFEASAKMQQITGDPATSNLAMNLLPVATGTLSPLSIFPSQLGTGFISPDGLRFIKADGTVTQPVGDNGTGVTVPFIFAVNPSRTCAAANADTLRISVKNGNAAGTPVQAYWFDLTRNVWSGPHTFAASLIQPWRNTFVISADGINATLWQSDPVISSTSTYVENGSQLSWSYQTVLLPDDSDDKMLSVQEGTIMLAIANATVSAIATDDLGQTLDTIFFSGVSGGTNWDAFVWDGAVWDASPTVYRQRALQWHVSLVAKQMAILFSGNSAASVRIGNLTLRVQELGYQSEYA